MASVSHTEAAAAAARPQPVEVLFASLGTYIGYVIIAAALMIPPSAMSRKQLCIIFLPLLTLWEAYMYTFPGVATGVQILAPVFWGLDLLAWRDVRGTFKRIHRTAGSPSSNPTSTPSTSTPEPNGHSDGSNGHVANIKHSNKDPTPHVWEEPYPSSLVARLKWIFYLNVSIRLTNWIINDARHDTFERRGPNNHISRRARMIQLLRRICIAYVISDICGFWALHDPYFNWRNRLTLDSPLPSTITRVVVRAFGHGKIAEQIISHPRFWRLVVAAVPAWATIDQFFAAVGLSFLTLGGLGLVGDQWGHPAVWRPASGSLLSIADRGVRGVWGNWWHQMLRYLAGDPGQLLGKWYLSLVSPGSSFSSPSASSVPASAPASSSASSKSSSPSSLPSESSPSQSTVHTTIAHAIHVATAFFISGVLHAYMLPKIPTEASSWNLALFFWIQIPGVAIEMFVEHVFLRPSSSSSSSSSGPSKSPLARILRFTWALVYLYATFPLIGEQFVKLQLWDVYAVPLSPCRWLFNPGEGIGFWTWPPRT